MQSDALFVQGQPFTKLAQANMQLLMRFAVSPEVASEATTNASQLLQQTSGSAMKLMSSGAFVELMQGMARNYMQFLTEVSEGSMAMLSAGQADFARQAQDGVESILQANGRGRRTKT